MIYIRLNKHWAYVSLDKCIRSKCNTAQTHEVNFLANVNMHHVSEKPDLFYNKKIHGNAMQDFFKSDHIKVCGHSPSEFETIHYVVQMLLQEGTQCMATCLRQSHPQCDLQTGYLDSSCSSFIVELSILKPGAFQLQNV